MIEFCRRSAARGIHWSNVNRATKNDALTLPPATELAIWLICTLGACLAFFTAHTMFVTAGTYVSGAALIGITGFLFWMRFRLRHTLPTRSVTLISNVALVLLTLVVLLYLLGVATWYE